MQRLISVIAVVLLSAGVAFGQPCPDGEWCQWTGNGHWYRLTTTITPGSWNQAEAEAVALGGHLVTINSEQEQLWLNAWFPGDGADGIPYWIGFYQDTSDPDYSEPDHAWKWIEDSGLCRWVVGNPTVCYTNWAPHSGGEPNNNHPDGEEFAAMHVWANGLWNDYPNTLTVPLVGIIERVTDPAIPTVSEWGLAVMALLVLSAGTVVLTRRRRVAQV